MPSVITLCWPSASTWEALGVWVEAGALFLIFFLDLRERQEAREERRLQREAREEERRESEERRKVREEERQERQELRLERQRLEGDRQRDNVTCLGVSVFAETVTKERLCSDLWKRTNTQAGFALQKHFRDQLPEYLLSASRPFYEEIRRATTGGSRYWLVFKFPYRHYGAVLSDLRILNLGDDSFVAWDEDGKAVAVEQE